MRDLRLAFISRILSSYTHEVNNYLAIIKETNGLMKDVIQIGKSRTVEAKQFLGFIGCVEEQIARATSITDYLHRFANRMACERVAVSINELIEELIALMTRLAYRKRISFEKVLRGGLPPAVINPILLNYLIFCIIDRNLSSLDKNGIVSIFTSLADGHISISVSAKGEKIVQDGASEFCSGAEISCLASELGVGIAENGCETLILVSVTG